MRIPPAIAAIAPDGQLTPAQRRRILIDICRRRIRPGTGSALEFLQRRTAMIPWPDLRPILENIPWVIVGGVATRAYMPERATKDLDILVRREDGDEVQERLEEAGYTFVTDLAVPGFLVRSPEDVELDVILGDYPWLDEALANPRQDVAGYPVLDLPYLVLMKMESSRGRDVGDLTTMLGLASDEELDRVRAAVTRYAPTEMDDLESLIYLGRFETQSGS
ncbi:MAG: nucleotidyltransferase domain-containing protein [Anaerolineae bacterium]